MKILVQVDYKLMQSMKMTIDGLDFMLEFREEPESLYSHHAKSESHFDEFS